ncbi:MAG: DUF4340 domain-containing protein [Anaerolineales bacterium]
MIRRGTWIVLAVFVGLLGVYLWWSQQAATPPEGEATPTPGPLWSVTAEQIQKIEVEDLQAELRVVAQRQAGVGWAVIEPEGAVQDAGRVERAATWLLAPVPRAEIGPQEDLEPFGLVEPSYKVTVTLSGGTELVLDIGRETPTGSSRYVNFAGREGVLVFSQAGLDEVLGLLDDLIAPPTPIVPPTATRTEVPGEDTPTPVATSSYGD